MEHVESDEYHCGLDVRGRCKRVERASDADPENCMQDPRYPKHCTKAPYPLATIAKVVQRELSKRQTPAPAIDNREVVAMARSFRSVLQTGAKTVEEVVPRKTHPVSMWFPCSLTNEGGKCSHLPMRINDPEHCKHVVTHRAPFMRCLRKDDYEDPDHSTFRPEVYLMQHRNTALSLLAKQMDAPMYDVVRKLTRKKRGPFFRGKAAFEGDLSRKQEADLRNIVLDHIIACAKRGTVATDVVLQKIFPCKSLPAAAQCITGAHGEKDRKLRRANDAQCTRTLHVDGEDELIQCDDNDRSPLTSAILDANPNRYQEFLRRELPRGMRSKRNGLELRKLLSKALQHGLSEQLSKFLQKAKPCIMTGHKCTLGRLGDTSDPGCQHYFTAAMPVVRCKPTLAEHVRRAKALSTAPPTPEHTPADEPAPTTPEHTPADEPAPNDALSDALNDAP